MSESASRMAGHLVAAVLVSLWAGDSSSLAAVPAPSSMPARIQVEGRSSTATEVAVAAVGQEIPLTFSGDRVKNTQGFCWYVSRHFAMKTDYAGEKAKFYLTLLEQAWPHYVELFGAEPAGVAKEGKRLAVVYGSSKAQLQKALLGDGIVWDFRGGGITYESGYRCAYVYPSGTLQYHQRYILLHECTHLFQMCLAGTLYNTPGWFHEGLADALGHHVHESASGRTTLLVLDKATTANYLDDGLAAFRREKRSLQEAMHGGGMSRGQGFLLVHFLRGEPWRLAKFQAWRDKQMAGKKCDARQAADELAAALGGWEKFEAELGRWRGGLSNTFHYAEWGWEQDGPTLWSYGFAEGGRLSRTDVLLPPGRGGGDEPWRMDYPRGPAPALVGPIARGAAEPSIGAVIDFGRCPGRGVAGIGLGLVEADGKAAASAPAARPGEKPREKPDATWLGLMIERQWQLLVEGEALGIENKSLLLPAEFRDAMKAGGQRVGMTVKVGSKQLEVTLRAGEARAGAAAAGGAQARGGAAGQAALVVYRASIPLSESQRKRVMERPMTILSRGGWHGVTPFVGVREWREPVRKGS